jgi:hypothetical protein
MRKTNEMEKSLISKAYKWFYVFTFEDCFDIIKV